MSIEMASRRDMKIAGVVYNWCPEADPLIEEDSKRMILKYLHRYYQPEVLVELPEVKEPLPEPDFGAIFDGAVPKR